MKVIAVGQNVDAEPSRGRLQAMRLLPFPAAVVPSTPNRQSVARTRV